LVVGAALVLATLAGAIIILLLFGRIFPQAFHETIEVQAGSQANGAVYQNLLVGKILTGRAYQPPADPADRGDPRRDLSRRATTYYHRDGPVGRVMEKINWFPGPADTYAADARLPASVIGAGGLPVGGSLAQLVSLWSEPPFAAVFLKEGGMASYARPYQHVDFYERNPDIVRLSVGDAGTRTFHLVHAAQTRGAVVRILAGDERTNLTNSGPRRFYHVLVVDVLRGHSLSGKYPKVTQELLTREAMQQYFEALVEDGVLCVHVSNRVFNLDRVVADAVQDLGLGGLLAMDNAGRAGGVDHYSSQWVMVARRAENLRFLTAVPANRAAAIRWTPTAATGKHLWTDEGTNSLLDVLR
jgi:hypothetical protein